MNKRVSCIHLLNNFSGSPNVLATVADGLCKENYKVTVVTSFNNIGFLSDLQQVVRKNINYSFKENKFLRLLHFIEFQLLAAFYVMKIDRNEIIYINTVQPFLPAIIAKLKRQKVIYHIHEAYPTKSLLNKFLFRVVYLTASKIICVSNYVKDELEPVLQYKAFVVYNSLSHNFLDNRIAKKTEKERKNILMISSAREYKGIFEFCELAISLPKYNFNMVCDTSEKEIQNIFYKYLDVPNLHIYGTQENLHPYYAVADLVMNLSNPQQIIETFGLTVLEGMSYGIPAIVPPVGGIAELVEDNVNGYKVNVNDKELLMDRISSLLEEEGLYQLFSYNALKKFNEFDQGKQLKQINNIIF